MTLPDFLANTAQMDFEHTAWTELCAKLTAAINEQQSEYCARLECGDGLAVDANLNDARWNVAIDAIRLWGERLVALRSKQDEGTRQSALDDAITLVVDGRP